jgi:hypothetical protein
MAELYFDEVLSRNKLRSYSVRLVGAIFKSRKLFVIDGIAVRDINIAPTYEFSRYLSLRKSECPWYK